MQLLKLGLSCRDYADVAYDQRGTLWLLVRNSGALRGDICHKDSRLELVLGSLILDSLTVSVLEAGRVAQLTEPWSQLS